MIVPPNTDKTLDLRCDQFRLKYFLFTNTCSELVTARPPSKKDCYTGGRLSLQFTSPTFEVAQVQNLERNL